MYTLRISCSFWLCIRPNGLSCPPVLPDCLVTWLTSSLSHAWLFQPSSVACGLTAWVCASVVVRQLGSYLSCTADDCVDWVVLTRSWQWFIPWFWVRDSVEVDVWSCGLRSLVDVRESMHVQMSLVNREKKRERDIYRERERVSTSLFQYIIINPRNMHQGQRIGMQHSMYICIWTDFVYILREIINRHIYLACI